MSTIKSQPWGWTHPPNITLHNHMESGFSKGDKGNRPIHPYGSGGDVLVEHDLSLVLGLGCTPGSSNGADCSESGNSTRMPCVEDGEQDDVPVDLRLALNQSSGAELKYDCLTPSKGIVSSVTTVTRASLDSETQGHADDSSEAGTHRNSLIRLEGVPLDVENGDGTMTASGMFLSHSGENICGMDLQLGLLGSSLTADSGSLSGMPSTVNGVDTGDNRIDGTNGEQFLMDEGSTSARWMKSRGFLSSLLHGGHAMANQLTQDDKAQQDLLEIKKTSTVPTSAWEGFAAFSGLTPKMTTCTSSFGALAGVPQRASKTCKFKGCSKGARGASGLCIAHGGGRRCQRPNCSKGAEGRTMYCKGHGGGRRCQSLGCIKSAEGRTDFCIAHGGGRRCTHEGCSKAARGKSGLCIRHGGGKRCQKEGCTKSAEGFPGLCISHGGGRRCQYPGCEKGAQGSTMFCKAHGGGRRCMFEGCTKGAEGSTSFCKGHGGGKRCMFEGGNCTKSVHGGTLFCVAHGGGKRCAVQGCTKSARGRTDYCVRHGGGKRCEFENCSKSAQGSTNFCKAHGGGKRCSWSHEGSRYSGDILIDEASNHLKGPCDKFATGKTGLCAAHTALVQQVGVSWDGTCPSFSKTLPSRFHQPIAMPVHNDQKFYPVSDVSEQTSQFASENGYDEQTSRTAGRQLLQCARGHHEIEGDSHKVTVTKANLALRKPDAGLYGMPFDMNDALKSSLFAVAQHPPGRASNTFRPPKAISSVFSTELVLPPNKQKGGLPLVGETQYLPHACPSSTSDAISTFSISVLEERVHGGGLMAFLAREAGRQRDLE